MEVKGLTVLDFAAVVNGVSVQHYNGNVILAPMHPLNRAGTRFRGRVLVRSSREAGARRSWSGRRMPAACWHVFRDVVRATLAQYPEAQFTTRMARYTAATFETTYPATGTVNIGSTLQPAYLPDLCECDGGYTGPTPAQHRNALRTAVVTRVKHTGPPCGWCAQPTPGEAFAWCGQSCQENWQELYAITAQ